MVAAVGVPWRAQLRSAHSTIVGKIGQSEPGLGLGLGLGFGGQGTRWMTTVLCIRKDDEVVIVGDGQVGVWVGDPGSCGSNWIG